MRIQTKRLSKKTYLTILSVVLVLVTMIGTSFGFLMKINEIDTSYSTGVLSIELITTGEDYGKTINLNNTVPMTDEEGKDLSPYKFKITNTGTLNYQFDIKLVLDEAKMTEDGCTNNTLNFSNVKIQIDDGKPVLLSSLTDSILISDVVLAPDESKIVSIRMWLDENTTNEAIGKHFHAKVATDGYAIETEQSQSSLTMVFSNLYASAEKTTVVNNSINYEYAPSVSMMKDIGGNIRYYGADPDNYIYFNCSDYNNQNDTTCEKWRIIGIFDGRVKIIRNEDIGNYSWDTSVSGINEGYGINQWGLSTYTNGSMYEGGGFNEIIEFRI